MATYATFPVLSAEEAAEQLHDGATVGFSGFTAAGSAKAVPRAFARRAQATHAAGESLRIRALTGASTGEALDETLAAADALAWRAPYQSSRSLRGRINRQECEFLDMHLSHVPQMIEFGFLGNIDVAVIEAVDVTRDGRVFLSTSAGISPSLLRHADRVFIELNARHSQRLSEMHDIVVQARPPHRQPIPIFHSMDRIGRSFAVVDPERIAGVIHTDEPDGIPDFKASDAVSQAIGRNVVEFLLSEREAGRIPREFLPLQAGVGNISNAVMGGLCSHEGIPPFQMYTEVLQDSQVDAMLGGHVQGISTAALTVTDDKLQTIYDQMDFFSQRIVIRPQEISNHPGIIRRLGVIAINVAVEFDIYGMANSTHACGTKLINGIGGSGDFMRNAYLSIFVTPSTAKGGAISSIVPMVTHVDHNEHSVQILVTEQGVADCRGLGPLERARTIIDNCAHPSYRDYLHRYVENAPGGSYPSRPLPLLRTPPLVSGNRLDARGARRLNRDTPALPAATS